MLTDSFTEALAFASTLHRGHVRKGTTIRYVSHLLAVTAIVLEAGGDERQAMRPCSTTPSRTVRTRAGPRPRSGGGSVRRCWRSSRYARTISWARRTGQSRTGASGRGATSRTSWNWGRRGRPPSWCRSRTRSTTRGRSWPTCASTAPRCGERFNAGREDQLYYRALADGRKAIEPFGSREPNGRALWSLWESLEDAVLKMEGTA